MIKNLVATFKADDTHMCELTHLILQGHLSSNSDLLFILKKAELHQLRAAYGLPKANIRATKKDLMPSLLLRIKEYSYVPHPDIFKESIET